MLKIENEELTIKVEELGAELVGLLDKKTGKEYIWQKNPKYWAKSSPVLFPFVGGLLNNKYIYQDKEYKIETKHGFARDNYFNVKSQGKNFINFVFKSNEKTLEIYPFNFEFHIKYILNSRNLEIKYEVKNLSNSSMYFSLGAHPAFNVEVNKNIKFDDYYIEFEKEEDGIAKTFTDGFVDPVRTKKIFDGKILKLKNDTFKDDALIFENPNSNKVWLKNTKNNNSLEFNFEGFKYIAFWNVLGAEYVCFEPWNGISDYINTSGKLEEKKGIEVIKENEIYERSIKIII